MSLKINLPVITGSGFRTGLPWALLLCFLTLFSFDLQAAELMGGVTRAPSGDPVIGARIEVNGAWTYSITGGIYTLPVNQAGAWPIHCTKPGFQDFTTGTISFPSVGTVIQNITLQENLIPPASLSAVFDSSLQKVDLSWPAPSGPYEILYDDGVQDNFTVWATQGNMNAVRFTPPAWPLTLDGGMIHIGTLNNYPAGSNPFVDFQVMICDANGTGGAPGSVLAGPFTVTPSVPGWNQFSLPEPLTITSGSFFIVMIQGGNSPNAAGIAVDETTPQFRSYSRFVTGSGPWFPAGGNFMMRARCNGPGGPYFMNDAPDTWTHFTVFRLRQGEEQNPAAWTFLTSTGMLACQDLSWPLLPCAPYRWVIKTNYPGNNSSAARFSNVIGKCWTTPVSFVIASGCVAQGPANALLKLQNLALPDTVYTAIADSSGELIFPRVWKGNYSLSVSKFAYDSIVQSVQVMSTVALNLTLWHKKIAPENLTVNDSNLLARWDVPKFSRTLFSENWNSGTFTANNWTVEGGANWAISTGTGNPAPSAFFNRSPRQIGYSQSLLSKIISGQRSKLLQLRYDIYLDNAGTTTMNAMAVEVWNGIAWNVLKVHTNKTGDIPWSSEEIDISEYTDQNFKVRFRAYGGDSWDINGWNLDNISVVASEPAQELTKCILGYYFYLGNVITGYTDKNAYFIPSGLVQYGQSYQACVTALYSNGYSNQVCVPFTSQYLPPVKNIRGNTLDDQALIEWDQPVISTDSGMVMPPGLTGYRIYRDGIPVNDINHPDTLHFTDQSLEPGHYQYGVSAMYDLTPYGFPGMNAESMPDGPLHLTVNYGRLLPFYESWDAGSYSFNDWRFSPSQGNWTIQTGEGFPAPSSCFNWQPPDLSYSYALESPILNALDLTCASIWLDFDVKLNTRNATGTEKLIVEVFYNNVWNQKMVISNVSTFDWTSHHIEISAVKGKGFRIRFRAAGENSVELLNWFRDNIAVYPVCYPASDPAGEAFDNLVRLTWSPPVCYGGSLLNEGFEEPAFPPQTWSIQTTNTGASWYHAPASATPGVHIGDFSAGIAWDYNHQDEWIIAHNVYINGDLTFWSYAYQGSLHQDHYFVKISSDQGVSWTVLLDMSALPVYPGGLGINAWETPYQIDLSTYQGLTVDLAWHAVDGDGNGLWYPWAIDDCSIGADDQLLATTGHWPGTHTEAGADPTDALIGYDIYRKGYGNTDFEKINTVLVQDTLFLDPDVPYGEYYYFIRSQFQNCEKTTDSDTIQVSVITGTPETKILPLKIFPNPARERVTIQTEGSLGKIQLLNLSGIVTGTWDARGQNSLTIDLQGIRKGFYVLSILSDDHRALKKICIQ